MRNRAGKYFCFIILFWFFVAKSTAQSLPLSSYGTWDRGGQITNFSDPNVDFVLGIEATAKWEDIELVRGTFDFSFFQQELDKAYANNKLIRFSIGVGPDAPLWMFDNDTNPSNNPYPQVRKIYTSGVSGNSSWPFYPQYLTQTYKNYYFELIRQFSLFLRNQPQAKFNLIAFVQVKTGCTGDEVPFKGNVVIPSDDISQTDWDNFRVECFNKFKFYFNDVTTRKIVLTFNNIDPIDEPIVNTWVMDNIDPAIGFGIKGGAYNRGHHLNDEITFKNQWVPFLINPQGLKLFSASEMDNLWQDGYFAINPDLGFYWGALSGINVGLSTYNLNASSMNYVISNASTRETFRMFNRYAQQVYPATASVGFCIFHEGLNSADKNKFPENIYGPSNQQNISRYKKICNDPKYFNRGARMDDTISVTNGQVYQRQNQTGYIDAGWFIAEGNIERFFTQIKADSTSIGLFRVRGTINSTSSKYDRFARSFENATGKNTMYFKFDAAVFTNTLPDTLRFKIIWLDKTVGSRWSFKYKSPQGIKDAIQVTGVGGNTWKEVNFTITDAIVDKSGVIGSDFTLVNTDNQDDIFNSIEVAIKRVSMTLPVQFAEPLKAYHVKNGINVDWATASEINCDRFEIERSINAIDFNKIASVKGQNNSSNYHTYSILDADPKIGVNYYRIRQVDLDGKYTYSRIVSAKNEYFGIKISPNPVNDRLTIESSKPIDQIEIINAVGQAIKTFSGSNLTLNVKSLAKGSYYLKIYFKDQQVSTKQFSKI